MINALPVSTAVDYLRLTLKNPTEKQIDDFIDGKVDKHQYEAICEIIALEVAYYTMRRTAGFCASNIDHIWSLRNKHIKHYNKTFGKWKDYNKDVDF